MLTNFGQDVLGKYVCIMFCSVEVSSFTVVLQIICLPTWQLTDTEGTDSLHVYQSVLQCIY